jgi:hypothetical protein
LLAARRRLLLDLADDRVDARLRHRLAVDDGDVLRLRGQRCQAGGGEHDARGENSLLHGGTLLSGR